MKKPLSVLLAVCILLTAITAFSFTAFAQETDLAVSGENRVVIAADGREYIRHQGDEFEYEFYLYTGGRVGTIDMTTYFDTKGVTLLPYLDEDGDYDDEQFFPNLCTGGSLVTNYTKKDMIVFNFSNKKGKKFNAQPINSDANLVIKAKFKINAGSGRYEINSIPQLIADENENKLCFNGEKLGDYDIEGRIDREGDNIPTENPTDPPTEALKPSYILGDVDGDDHVTVLDATCIQRWLASIEVPYPIGNPAA